MGNECECDPCQSEELTSKIKICLENENLNDEVKDPSSYQAQNKNKNLSPKRKTIEISLTPKAGENDKKKYLDTKQFHNDSQYQASTSSTKSSKNSNHHFKWKKGDLIGSGACGQVYQGLNISNGQIIAIKSIDLSERKECAMKEMKEIVQEINFLKCLDHPNIIKYLQSEISPKDNTVDIILEYMPAGSIKNLIDKFGPINEKIIKIYTKQLLESLEYVHSKGIIHRDIKCANILLDNDGIIKLSDFGSSILLERNLKENDTSLCNSIKGSLYWISPEVILIRWQINQDILLQLIFGGLDAVLLKCLLE